MTVMRDVRLFGKNLNLGKGQKVDDGDAACTDYLPPTISTI